MFNRDGQIQTVTETTNYETDTAVLKAVKLHIEKVLIKESEINLDFVDDKFNINLQNTLRSIGIMKSPSEDDDCYYKTSNLRARRENTKSKVSACEIYICELEALLEVQKLYRQETKKPNSGVSNHIYLPVIMDYLFSFSVTSVNEERSFSKFKKIYGDYRHRLDDYTAFATANDSTAMRSKLKIDIYQESLEQSLYEICVFK
ncbi:hypothetical protein TPHA_0N01985 [Tetrapisispora phaffii CBS 4417]|uniref:Uncharacterized protein n=1 Tax=Tetrapisispora phaffii (strain ATCC 24235 / CBS 4417 / NBRC 1672 / NRRL Y-8282 / UCD 70-5) TaxID=1071381 RepID=G8C1F2_TETPH|nr:hypothetical protein TPHA_0N01985 [Tetrapisispora phaffii CBS 4417]CCE65980.1 hypothetical protein TPHA_0N01985 [Tetrapisispora phaffii CBS 4417]